MLSSLISVCGDGIKCSDDEDMGDWSIIEIRLIKKLNNTVEEEEMMRRKRDDPLTDFKLNNIIEGLIPLSPFTLLGA